MRPGRGDGERRAADQRAQVLLDEVELAVVLDRLADEIDRAYPADSHPDGVVCIGVLEGSLIFLADLVRRLRVDVEVDFLAISTFAPDSGRVRILKDLAIEIEGRDVLLVEDIVDTGLSLVFLRSVLDQRGARSVRVCTLLDRAVRRIVPVTLDFIGIEVPDAFVIGYGLGHTTWYRNLPVVALGDAETLDLDPGAYVEQFHGTAGGGVPEGGSDTDLWDTR